jgi:hypothetical protein
MKAAFQIGLVLFVCSGLAARAFALDKQGSAHGGQLSGADSGVALSGSLLAGAAFFNPTYAARPNNSGHALARLAPHFDLDLIGSRLSIPIDVNLFSDRDRSGLAKLAPSELDLISGLTSTWGLGPTALELGARIERDMPVDRGSYSQTYVDTRARLLVSLDAFAPGLREALDGGDISGSATLGLFAYNPSYAARPDNTGIALLRYGLHAQLDYGKYVFFGADTTFFTDRKLRPLAPSELDVSLDAGCHLVESLAGHL